MKLHRYTGGQVFTNGYVIETDEASIVIDAPALIHEVLDEQRLTPTHLLLTHQHFDHTDDVEALQARGAKVYCHSAFDESLIRQKEARENWGINVHIPPFEHHQLLKHGERLSIGGLEILIAHVPGHSTDSITFYIQELDCVFAGDTLMADCIGRTDLPGGNHQQLIEGIRNHLLTLPASTTVLSGHGEPTTIEKEKISNPFLR